MKIDYTMKNSRFLTYKDLYASNKVEIDLLLTDPAFDSAYNAIVWLLVKLGLKKIALLKLSDKENFEWIVKCPYCHTCHYQKHKTKNYKCPNCNKKSTIITGRGTLTSLLTKRINNPEKDNLLWIQRPKIESGC